MGLTKIKKKIVFIGGIHGVGKSTLCNSICAHLNAEHHSASELISRIGETNYLSTKRVTNIGKNQDVLITAINKYLGFEKAYLLDGHFCLLNQNGDVAEIPFSTFEAISPVAIVVLFDDPSKIYTRLKERDKERYIISSLSAFQENEINYSKSVASHLNIPYLKANPFVDSEAILKFVAKFL
ncbi:MAG: AAA family ATPase [Nitrosomonas sp.]|nr:AAA family ATPase [Nitrosomonas sp.]